MKQQGLFILGTDTDAGKTFIAARLGGLLKAHGYDVSMHKPIASGAKRNHHNELYSEDAMELMRLTKIDSSKANFVNPICVPGEYSPKIAANLSNTKIDTSPLISAILTDYKHHDITIVEGAGGITTPIVDDYSFTEFAAELNFPALLITDCRLGSINRMLLTVAYARQKGIHIIGFIGNDRDDTETTLRDTNIQEMKYYTKLPCFGIVPHFPIENYPELKNVSKDNHKFIDTEIKWFSQYIDISALEKALQT